MDIVYLIETLRVRDSLNSWSWLLCLLCLEDDNKTIKPALDNMKTTIIRLIDQLRLLDQDMISLQKK